MSNAIYMDANATTPPSATALAALKAAVRVTGNPSSVHGFGRAARGLRSHDWSGPRRKT